MTSDREAFVWIWLPGETEPVVAGRLLASGGHISFNYGKNYLERAGMSIYGPELPLRAGALPLLEGLAMPGSIRDAAPDAWGRRVILSKVLGRRGADTAELGELTYLLESGSDRPGALDFQRSASQYEPRLAGSASMEELLQSAERVEKGVPLTAELDMALLRGSSIGGARPKALVQDQGKKYVAKFSASADLYSVVKAEFVAMRLAATAGLNVAPVSLVRAGGKDVLLVGRFDRLPCGEGWSRKAMVSALTMLELDEMMARYASYETYAGIIRQRFTQPKESLREMFARMVFNVLCGNTDDHARNHAAFWDGRELALTPAYDLCPQARADNEASQAMLIHGDNNLSQVKTCLAAASSFLLSREEAGDMVGRLESAIAENWGAACEEAGLGEVDRRLLWGRQFLNPFALQR